MDTNIYQIGEKVNCAVNFYDTKLRRYKVTTISDGVVGYIPMQHFHPIITPKLKEVINSNSIITLKYVGIKNGVHTFKYIDEFEEEFAKGDTNETAATELIDESPEEPIQEPLQINLALPNKDSEFNKTLITSLWVAIGDKIDTQEKYDLAVNLLALNQKLKVIEGLSKNIFIKATMKYQSKLWTEGLTSFCSNYIVKNAWSNADEDEKKTILKRLGINLDKESAQTVSYTSDNTTSYTVTHPAPQDQRPSSAPVNNTNRSTQEVEHTANARAIETRIEKQQTLHSQQTNLRTQSQLLNQRHVELRNRQQSVVSAATQRMATAQNQQERDRIERESRAEQEHIQQEIQEVNTQQANVLTEINNISEQITITQQEIRSIEQTSKTETIGGRGKLKINLKWNTYDDVDLHVYDPSNNHIYYKEKSKTCQGVTGQLDVDANAGSGKTLTPQENIFWEDKAPIGHYKVDVNMFSLRSGLDNIPFTLTVIPEIGEPKTFTNSLKRNKETIHVVEFDYTDNGIVYKE